MKKWTTKDQETDTKTVTKKVESVESQARDQPSKGSMSHPTIPTAIIEPKD
ncbi:hypothetical protein DPMN_131084 [Dreissena polymorpha]|uniref:Uncharacterized protein n=1 Tax=Dreissena polymorpha TaxID=45954 RepID=A0A9D4H3Z7_DREPO|nr:hypothetical protein DPMN_131084 [Dreissena polymorpha]